MSDVLFRACKELIDDAKAGCADLVFKEICIEILSRAKAVLDDKEFKALTEYASFRMQEQSAISVDVIR
ncbi:MAG: hypothetical protein JSV05_00735 [Candidatus Bathyarchaeota archaeon]|nr:MAG: hypothetical protein JSV05_00735 [Candidatus Bathyarchaeota archaeon]